MIHDNVRYSISIFIAPFPVCFFLTYHSGTYIIVIIIAFISLCNMDYVLCALFTYSREEAS